MSEEIDNILARYRRRGDKDSFLYDPLLPYNSMVEREKRSVLIRLINKVGLNPVADKAVLEIGCGGGTNLLQLILLGFRPENLVGNELIEDRSNEARHVLPSATKVITGDGAELDFPDESFDVVLQSTVFTSILDDSFQVKLANRMWAALKRGGGVLWYDYVYDNPWNLDVRGVTVARIRDLFPEGKIRVWRVTLAPPLGRMVTRMAPCLYTLFNAFSFLRTHVMCWIGKAES